MDHVKRTMRSHEHDVHVAFMSAFAHALPTEAHTGLLGIFFERPPDVVRGTPVPSDARGLSVRDPYLQQRKMAEPFQSRALSGCGIIGPRVCCKCKRLRPQASKLQVPSKNPF